MTAALLMSDRTYRFSHILGKVRDVEVGGALVTLGLEARVERFLDEFSQCAAGKEMGELYSCKANFITQLVESTDAKFGVANIEILGKTKTKSALVRTFLEMNGQSIPLASTSGSIYNGLRGFDFSESSCIRSKSLVVSLGMKTTNVDVTVARDWVRQALVKSTHALARGEYGWNSTRNSWMLEKQCINVNIDWNGLEG
jgi:hypothetical protein